MDPIGRRPRPLQPSPTLPRAEPKAVQPGSVQAPVTVGHTLRSTFESTVKPAQVQAQAAGPMPGAWRGGPETEVGKAIAGMVTRLRESGFAQGIQFKGDTAESLFTRSILDNPRVSNDMLLAMTQVKLEQLATEPHLREKVLQKIPDAREQPSHKFTVALLAAATGLDPQKLSEVAPDLGMTGAPNTPLLYAPRSERMQRSTALHDFTDYLRGAGIKGLNKAVWGVENRILSAAVSALGGGRY